MADKSKDSDVAALTRRVAELEQQIIALRRRYVAMVEKSRTFRQLCDLNCDTLLGDEMQLRDECDRQTRRLAVLNGLRVHAGELSQADLDNHTLTDGGAVISFHDPSAPMMVVSGGILVAQQSRRHELIRQANQLLRSSWLTRLRMWSGLGDEPELSRAGWAEALRLLSKGKLREPGSGVTPLHAVRAAEYELEAEASREADLRGAEDIEALAGEPT